MFTPKKDIEVDAETIRAEFNRRVDWAHSSISEFIVTNKHRKNPTHNLPYCTHSQFVALLDQTGQPVAYVHQLRLPDGRLGGSGKPDPRQLLVNGKWWYTE